MFKALIKRGGCRRVDCICSFLFLFLFKLLPCLHCFTIFKLYTMHEN